MREQDYNTKAKLADCAAGSMSMPARDPKWDECPLELKIERVRNELRHARNLASAAYTQSREALELAQRHQHNRATGEVLKAAIDNLNRLEGGISGNSFDPLA